MIHEHSSGINVDVGRVAKVFNCSQKEALALLEKYNSLLDRYTFRILTDLKTDEDTSSLVQRYLSSKWWVEKLATAQYASGLKIGVAETKETLREKLGL